MSDPSSPPESETCPLDCPNRKTDGITLTFAPGQTIHLDPFELFLYLLLMLPCGVMVREAFTPDYTFEKAAARVGAVAALAWGIRQAPTESIYEWLSNKKLDKR